MFGRKQLPEEIEEEKEEEPLEPHFTGKNAEGHQILALHLCYIRKAVRRLEEGFANHLRHHEVLNHAVAWVGVLKWIVGFLFASLIGFMIFQLANGLLK